MSYIQCDDMEGFLEVCADMVRKGIGFKANLGDLRVYMTGGF